MKKLSSLATALLLAAVVTLAQAQALRPEVGRPLQQAYDLIKAGKGKEALAKVREAEAAPNKTATESLQIDRMKAAAAQRAGDSAAAIQALESLFGKVPGGEQGQIAEQLASAHATAKNNARASEWVQKAQAAGNNGATLKQLQAYLQSASGDFSAVAKDAAAAVSTAEQAGRKPDEADLLRLADAQQRGGNNAGQAATLEKLLFNHPKKDYWGIYLSRLQRKSGFSDRFSLDVMRLRLATGSLSKTDDFMEMAQLALQAGSAGTVIFSPASYVVTESVGAVTLLVTRHAGFTGAVSVSYATIAGSAVAGADFVAQSGTLNWADGESGTKIITVQILQDRVLDGPKGFTVTIETLTGGVSTGAPGVTKAIATVEINDADTDNFPSGCMLPLTGWTFPAPGWSVATDAYFGASCSLKTNPTADSGSARIQFVGNFMAGTISFARRVSSQTGNDCLRFFIDGVEQNIGGTCASGLGVSGETAWAMLSFNISVGAHTLVWLYEKDASGATGADAAWIDSVVLPLGGAPQIQSAPPAGGFLNIAYFHQFVVGGSPTISYALLSSSLPNGLSLNTSTGVISGIPRTLGTFSGFVRAFNDAFPPFAQQPFVISIVGAAPSAPVIDAALTDSSRARISASLTTSVGSAPITSYTATCNPGAIAGTSATSIIDIVGLVNGVEYSCAITATNIYGPSAASAPVIVMPVATKPGAPLIGTATPGNARAFIGFLPPVSDGGMAITTYTAVCNPGMVAGIGNVSPIVVNNLTNGNLYNCVVTATNAVGMSVASATAAVTPSTTTPLTLLGVVSRKSHGVAGSFELPINTAPTIAGAVTVEPRSIGNGHQVVFRFNNAVNTRVSPIVLDAANGSVGASLLVFDTDVIVSIPSVADATRVAIFLNGVNGSSQVFSAALGFLIGDVTSSHAVNASDISGVKARTGQMTTAGNFLFDLNASGNVNSSDIQMVKVRAGAVLP